MRARVSAFVISMVRLRLAQDITLGKSRSHSLLLTILTNRGQHLSIA